MTVSLNTHFAGANVGAAYKVPNRAASMHYDPDVNRTDYKRLQISTTIQNAVSLLHAFGFTPIRVQNTE
jgi:hypothetical protein